MAASLALLAVLVFSAIVLALRYWILPDIAAYRSDIEQAISSASGQRISIGAVSAGWDGVRPRLALGDVTVFDAGGRAALTLSEIESTLSWTTLLSGEVRFKSIEIAHPQLDVWRNAQGIIYVAGIAVNQPGADSGFADWLLHQGRIAVRDARIIWHDDQRAAPPLALRAVNLRLENSGNHHRFGLRATPPAGLSAPLDLRGDLVGRTVENFAGWRGRLFVQLDYADLGAWRKWLTFPIELRRGDGAMRAWLEFDNSALTRLTADVRLDNVQTRLAQGLPELDLDWMRGRLGWTWLADEFALSADNFAFAARGGLRIDPTDFSMKLTRARQTGAPEGELRINALELGKLVAFAEYLPLPEEWNRRLQQAAPRGTLRDVALGWLGKAGQADAWPFADQQLPPQFSVKANFSGLAVKSVDGMPAFEGMSGEIIGDESAGRLLVDARNGSVELPRVFEQALPFTVLAGEMDWRQDGEATELKLRSVSFANEHLAGSLGGSYRDGVADLSGSLTRADARQVWRYLPLTVGRDTREWLHASLVAGESREVRLKLKGRLSDFPFADPRQGLFQVNVHATGGVLDFAAGWPRIEGIDADLTFQGKRMEVQARQAAIMGVRLGKVNAVIPDLESFDEQLQVSGEAEAPTADFLRFVNKSPVAQMTGSVSAGVEAEGSGKLVLQLDLPLRRSSDTKLRGSYEFRTNRVVLTPELPPVEQLSGLLEFSEATVKASNMQALVFGGPTTISLATGEEGGTRALLRGRADFDNWAKLFPAPWLGYLHGVSDWRASVALRDSQTEVVFDSNLRGVFSDLPEPFAKAAAEERQLHFEQKSIDEQQERLVFSYGDVVAARVIRRREGGEMKVERGAVVLGGPPALPARRGLWISGRLPFIDLDKMHALMSGLPGGGRPSVKGLDVRLDSVRMLHSRFTNLHLTASAQEGEWQAKVDGPEISGNLLWQPEAEGKLTARLKHLFFVGDYSSGAPAAGASTADERNAELPALDIVADDFRLGDKQLGKLEIIAAQRGGDWLIDKVGVYNGDATLNAKGVWQSWLSEPRAYLGLDLEVNDIGRLFARLGLSEGIKGGSAKLSGPLTWVGSPARLDYATLSGELALQARHGQFVKLQPGPAKLLGVLSLQALPRRVTLDFKDIFSEGFAFEGIDGNIKIERGMARTDDFVINGSVAKVAMSGSVDLAAETQNLRVVVLPTVGESVSVAGALLGGPVAGITAFLVQKLLRDPLDRLVSFEYKVTGTWSDPTVVKVEQQAQH